MATEPKTEMFLFRMSVSERRMLDGISKHADRKSADILRQLIRREYVERCADIERQAAAPRAKRPKPKRK